MASGRQLHIVFICNELPPAAAGGIGPAVLAFAEVLHNLGNTVSVIGAYDHDHAWNLPFARVITVSPATFPGVNRLVSRNRLTATAIYSALRQLNRAQPIDIVEWPDFEGLFVKKIPGVVDVMRNHGPLMSHRLAGLAPLNEAIERAELRTMRSIENWIGVSSWFLEEWLRLSGARPLRKTVVPNPVDISIFFPTTEPASGPPFVLHAGTLCERKGTLALAKASNLFMRELPNIRLFLVGREREDTLAQIERLIGDDIRPRVVLAHPMPQRRLAELMRRATVFAMPSLLESFGTVWAEAMASGVPVVGSTRSCGPEVVPHGRAGLLVDPSDSSAIADAIVKLVTNPELSKRLGSFGREYALKHYSLGKTAQETLDFYHTCLDAQARTRPRR